MGLQRRSVGGGSNDKDFDPIENLKEGEHEARLVYIADLGIQEGMVWKGEQKPPAQQIALGYEIVGQTVTLDGEEKARYMWGSPFNIFKNLTEKGKELPLYQVFEPDAEAGGDADWEAQLGKPCSVRVKHAKGKGDNEGRVFDNIAGVNPIPEKYQDGVEDATLEFGVGNADEGDDENPVNAALFGLAKWVFDKRIKAAPVDVASDQGFKGKRDLF